jgi:hypothetical protein
LVGTALIFTPNNFKMQVTRNQLNAAPPELKTQRPFRYEKSKKKKKERASTDKSAMVYHTEIEPSQFYSSFSSVVASEEGAGGYFSFFQAT